MLLRHLFSRDRQRQSTMNLAICFRAATGLASRKMHLAHTDMLGTGIPLVLTLSPPFSARSIYYLLTLRIQIILGRVINLRQIILRLSNQVPTFWPRNGTELEMPPFTIKHKKVIHKLTANERKHVKGQPANESSRPALSHNHVTQQQLRIWETKRAYI